MSPEAGLRRIIKQAERILPGRPAPNGERDPRWQAIMRMEDYIPTQPEPIWDFIRTWGKHPQADVRTAVAVLLLEHLLEHHFERIYPRIGAEVKASKRFADTLRRCWWLGEAALPANARKLDRLAGVRRQRIRPMRRTSSFSPFKRRSRGARSLSTKMVDAVIAQDLKAIARLLDAGHDVNARNESGETAFSYACANNALESAKLLHARGADINTIDKGNGSPLDWAVCWSSREFCAWLESVGGKRHDVPALSDNLSCRAVQPNPVDRH